MEVQIFGVKKSADTRKALRFFSERRVKTHFIDFAERGPSEGELRRFVQRLGLDALIDKDSSAYADLGLRHARYGDDKWIATLLDEPRLLRMPLVRELGSGAKGLTVGLDETAWSTWVDRA